MNTANNANITVNINTVNYSLVSNPSISLWLLQTIQSLYSDTTQSTISVRNCLKLQYTNNTLFSFSLYNSLTIIVQIATIVLLIINFASDVHMYNRFKPLARQKQVSAGRNPTLLGRHGRTRDVMTYKRWMSARRRPSQLLVTARSGDHSSSSVPAGTAGPESKST